MRFRRRKAVRAFRRQWGCEPTRNEILSLREHGAWETWFRLKVDTRDRDARAWARNIEKMMLPHLNPEAIKGYYDQALTHGIVRLESPSIP